jgi:hypothetical protein
MPDSNEVKAEKHNSRSQRYYRENKAKVLARSKEYKRGHPHIRRAQRLKTYWPNLNPRERFEAYDKLFVEQNGLCKICKQPETTKHGKTGNIIPLSVDHNHNTGEIRGLLCSKCNHGLGLFKVDDGIEIVYKILSYLKKEKDT